MRIPAPVKFPLKIGDSGSMVNHPAWVEWFQRLSDYYEAVSKFIDPGSIYFGQAAPSNPTEGLMAFADGVNWDPGSGKGVYVYTDGSWQLSGILPPAGSVVSETSFGLSVAVGASISYARADHSHGSPTNPVPAHLASSDPHTQYQLESEKGQANGYASLGATAIVPVSQLASGTPDGTKYVRDDGTLATPPGGESGYAQKFLLMGG